MQVFNVSDNGQCILFNGTKLKIDCKILKNTKGLQLQLKPPDIYYYVNMLGPVEKKKCQRFQTTHLGFYINLISVPHVKNY